MPSQLHEGLISLFRDQPALAPELLASALQVDVPEYSEARIESADLTEIQPIEFRADLVIQLRREDSVLGIVVEVQLSRDDDKGFVWPVYIATLRNRIRCPVCLLVIAPDAGVAKWASRPILLGGNSRIVPWVLDAATIPEIVDLEQARAHPQLAVLSALAHGRDPNVEKAVEIALAAQGATEDLDTGHAKMYFDLITCCLSEAARRELEAMDPKKYQYQSEFARRYYGQGKEEGLAEGRAEMTLTILSKRFGSLPEMIQSRIRGASVAELNALADRLFSAHTLNEALGALS